MLNATRVVIQLQELLPGCTFSTLQLGLSPRTFRPPRRLRPTWRKCMACYSHALPPRTAMHLTDSPTTSPTPVTTTTRQVKDMPHALSQSEPADRVQMAGQQAARGGAGATFPTNT